MTGPTYPYGPSQPVYDRELLTVDRYLKNPTLLTKLLVDMTTQQFVSKFLFRPSPANAGVIVYDTALEQDLYVDVDPNRQPTSIEPGAEFPDVGFGEQEPAVALAKKYGAKFPVTQEQRDRDTRDIIGRGLILTKNTMIKQGDLRSLAVLRAHPLIPRVPAAAPWDTVNEKAIQDIQIATGVIDNTDLEYTADSAIINPMTATLLLNLKSIWDRLPRENAATNPLLHPQLNGFLNLQWLKSRRQPQGEITILQRGIIGTTGTEVPMYSRVVEEPLRERSIVMCGVRDVNVITDPLAAYTITNILS